MTYDGEDLQVAITDTKTGASHRTSYSVDVASHVGGPEAHVGFTGSSGLLTAVQDVLRWSYTPVAPRKKVPPPAGDVIYVCASRTNKSSELSLLVIDAATGKLTKNVTLGTHAVDPNQIYYDRQSEPSLAMVRDRLFVDTHAGALVAIAPQAAAIEWGIVYESPPPQSGYAFYGYQPPPLGTSGPLAAGGRLFAKGMRSPRIVAVEPGGPTIAWRRPIDVTAVLVGADDKRLYTGGEELAAYDLDSQELIWSTRLPRSAAWSAAVLTKTRLYQFTSRGIYEIDKQTGRVLGLFRGADLDALGGSLFVTPTALVTVSNVAITAYPLNEPPSDPPTDQEARSPQP
jgi:outer membrane protein assembly factor BamB